MENPKATHKMPRKKCQENNESVFVCGVEAENENLIRSRLIELASDALHRPEIISIQ